MSAFLEVEYDRKANEQATAHRRLCWQCRTCWVSISTSDERRPCRRSKAALQYTGRVSVTVAYQHYRKVYPMTEPTDGVTAVIFPPLRPLITIPAETDLPLNEYAVRRFSLPVPVRVVKVAAVLTTMKSKFAPDTAASMNCIVPPWPSICCRIGVGIAWVVYCKCKLGGNFTNGVAVRDLERQGGHPSCRAVISALYKPR